MNEKRTITGADPGFQVRGGAHLNKLRRAEGGGKMFGVFHDFTPKNHPPLLWFFFHSLEDAWRLKVNR
jgi:hypothetical protein